MCRATARRCIRRTRACWCARTQNFAFQMHYTTSGKPAHDVTRFGLYFRDSAPTYEFKTVALANPKHQDSAEHEGARRDDHARVPARHDHLPADAARALPRPGLAVHRDLSGWPRGDCCCPCRSTTSTGRRRTRWRSRCRFRRARRSCTRTVYDNSAQNPANPDPNRTVPWGEQSFDEMLYGVVQFRELTPVSATPVQVSSAGQ